MSSTSVTSKTVKHHSVHAFEPDQRAFRPKDPIQAILRWGVNHAMNELTRVEKPKLLLPSDFKAFSKLKVHNSFYNVHDLPIKFKFKEYCPLVFDDLRRRFGYASEHYRRSIVEGFSKEIKTSGRSGAMFYRSENRLLVMKTLTSIEVGLLHTVLQDYHKLVVENDGRTLLPQYLGVYRLSVEEEKDYYIVVMRNALPATSVVDELFDLKGSLVNRDADESEMAKEQPTWKDNDFLSKGRRVYLAADTREQLMETLRRDVAFLEKHRLMDYSLLMGIHKVGGGESNRNSSSSADGPAATETEGGPPPGTPMRRSAGSWGDLELSRSRDSGEYAGEYDAMVSASNDDGRRPRSASASKHDLAAIPDPYAFPSGGEDGADADAGGRYTYYMSIIDVLTNYSAKKRTAHAAKTVKHGLNAEISTVNPQKYGRRFVEFVDKTVLR